MPDCWATLLAIGRDPKHLGADLGFLAVLHTWDQKLRHHPHVHCVVPGGGLSSDGTRWLPSRAGFFLPVRVLSRLFRGKFLAKLRAAFDAGELSFAGSTAPLSTPAVFNAFVRRCRSKEWVVYAKAPFGSPEQVLKYLARYTHRVAISNARIEAIRGDRVTFRDRISSEANSHGSMQLLGVEFLRRFVQHVLPKGFTRIRSFEFLANCHKREKLRAIRDLLEVNAPKKSDPTDTSNESENAETCPSCGSHLVARVREIDPVPSLYWMPVPFAYFLKRPRKGSP